MGYPLEVVSEQKKPLLRPEYAILGKRLMVDSKQLKASHALARKQLAPKDYCKHIQYFLTLLTANFSSLVSSAKILTNLAAPKGKFDSLSLTCKDPLDVPECSCWYDCGENSNCPGTCQADCSSPVE